MRNVRNHGPDFVLAVFCVIYLLRAIPKDNFSVNESLLSLLLTYTANTIKWLRPPMAMLNVLLGLAHSVIQVGAITNRFPNNQLYQNPKLTLITSSALPMLALLFSIGPYWLEAEIESPFLSNVVTITSAGLSSFFTYGMATLIWDSAKLSTAQPLEPRTPPPSTTAEPGF